jgi:type IV pilus assembly protein PilW
VQLKHGNSAFHPLRSQLGVTLLELLISISLSIGLFAGMIELYASSTKSKIEVQRTNQQIENGRYAIQLLTDDLEAAGYWAEFDISNASLTAPADMPNPCSTVVSDLIAALPINVQGFDGGGGLSCITDRRAGTDVIVVRRVSTCIAGATNCDLVPNALYFQASLCNSSSELGSSFTTDQFRLSASNSSLDRHQKDCLGLADKRQFLVHIYFVANNDAPNDGIPTLKRAELGPTGFVVYPLSEGIENLQLEYGLDFAGNDGIPDVYTADPLSYLACSGANCTDGQQDFITCADHGRDATVCVTNSQNIMAVKINLLARNTTKSSNFTDTKTYLLGSKIDGTVNSVGPFNDAYNRHAYQTTVRLINPAGRRE